MENSLVQSNNNEVAIQQSNSFLLGALNNVGLPTQNLLVEETDRLAVLKNIGNIITKIPLENLPTSFYLSKFIVASFSGLFDAALNYLWDETIVNLRKRVVSYDLQYFYSNVLSATSRNNYSNEEDLKNLSDQDLLNGCKKLDLIDDITYKELDHIKYMRNWVSAAHPNNYGLTGYKMLGYLETCINVIKEGVNPQTANIKRILNNIKGNIIDTEQANIIINTFEQFSQNQVNSLCVGLFGIYVDLNTTQETLSNIEKIIGALWIRADEETKKQIGFKYSNYAAAIENEKKDRTERFLTLVHGLAYLSNDAKAEKIRMVLEDLKRVHHEWGNFYSEPTFAYNLKTIVGNMNIPDIVDREYVSTIVDVFLTNGNGVCNAGNSIYTELINRFNEKEAKIALFTFLESSIKNKLLNELCSKKFKELIDIIEPKITDVIYKSIAIIIKEENINLYRLEEDKRIREKLNYLNSNKINISS